MTIIVLVSVAFSAEISFATTLLGAASICPHAQKSQGLNTVL